MSLRQRESENAEFKDLMASNSAAKELILSAKNRLNKFYNPKLYTPPKKAELSAEDRIVENMGAGAMFAQVNLHRQQKAAPPPPPETWDAYSKKSEESGGVTAMLDLLVKDLDKEMTEAQTEETEGQKDYEALMQDSAEKRAKDSQSLSNKVAAKAELGSALEGHVVAKADSEKELHATLKYISDLHAECDWLLQYFDVRKEARAGEVDSLTKAKDILSG